MSVKVNNNKELADAVNRNEASIEICDPKTGKAIIRIKGVGAVAWVVAIGGIGITVAAILIPSPDPATKGIAAVSGGASFSILGGATVTAIGLAVAAGSVRVLNRIRGYKVTTLSNGHVLLTK